MLIFLKHASRILLGVFMTYAGISHMGPKREEFQAVVPRWLTSNVEFMDFIVVSSGIVEIILGLATIFLVKYKAQVGIIYAVFLALVFFGNLSQYTNEINAFGLDTDQKRFIRLLFQPIFMLWILWATDGLKLIISKF